MHSEMKEANSAMCKKEFTNKFDIYSTLKPAASFDILALMQLSSGGMGEQKGYRYAGYRYAFRRAKSMAQPVSIYHIW